MNNYRVKYFFAVDYYATVFPEECFDLFVTIMGLFAEKSFNLFVFQLNSLI